MGQIDFLLLQTHIAFLGLWLQITADLVTSKTADICSLADLDARL